MKLCALTIYIIKVLYYENYHTCEDFWGQENELINNLWRNICQNTTQKHKERRWQLSRMKSASKHR